MPGLFDRKWRCALCMTETKKGIRVCAVCDSFVRALNKPQGKTK